MAADGHFGYTKVAITLQPVCRPVARLPLRQLGCLVYDHYHLQSIAYTACISLRTWRVEQARNLTFLNLQ